MKSWDNRWEKVFQSQQWGKYPPEELVRFIARNFYKAVKRKDIKILDLGCGTGAGIWYLAREGFSTFGIDGSKTAISIARKRIQKENLEAHLRVGDLIRLNYPDGFFDGIVDIAAIQHNKTRSQRMILNEVFRVLKPNGKIFSMLISKRSRFSKENLARRVFTHFLGEDEIRNLFSKFKNLTIEISEKTDRGNFISYFIVSAEKN